MKRPMAEPFWSERRRQSVRDWRDGIATFLVLMVGMALILALLYLFAGPGYTLPGAMG